MTKKTLAEQNANGTYKIYRLENDPADVAYAARLGVPMPAIEYGAWWLNRWLGRYATVEQARAKCEAWLGGEIAWEPA